MEGKLGRPESYTPEIAAIICERLTAGESVLKICEDDDMPSESMVYRWIVRHPDFREIYREAREAWSEYQFDRMMQIADTPQIGQKIKTMPDGKVEITEGDMVEHRKLQVNIRQWALARMSPKRYGDPRPELNAPPSNFQLVVLSAGMELPTVARIGSGFVIDAEPA